MEIIHLFPELTTKAKQTKKEGLSDKAEEVEERQRDRDLPTQNTIKSLRQSSNQNTHKTKSPLSTSTTLSLSL